MSEQERRDSPRIPVTLWIRDPGAANAEWEERKGNLALGGVHWHGEGSFTGTRVEVHFVVPGSEQVLWVSGEILRTVQTGNGIDFHARFTELDVKDELLLARALQSAAP